MNHTIYNENCLDTMKNHIAPESIDLVVTSPPYDNFRDYKGYSFPFENIADALTKVLSPGGVIIWIINDQTFKGTETLTSFKQAIYFKETCGLNVHDTMIWAKNAPSMPSINRYAQVTEYMFVFSKGKPKTFNPLIDKPNKWKGKLAFGKNSIRQKDGSMKKIRERIEYKEFGMRYNVWNHKTSAQEAPCKKKWHPATFPLQLAKDHIISWSNEGDLVYDPFMGSGTTAKACYDLNRRCIGSEMSKEYYLQAENDLKKYYSENRLF